MCTLPRVLARTRASADFRFLPSPFTDLPQLTAIQHTRGEHLSHTTTFTFSSPSLSRFSPTEYGKVPLFPTLPRYFSRHSPSLASSKIGHRTGEGIFVKAFTLYALIYCTLRSIGEGVKAKIENRLTRAREETRKTHRLHLVASRRGRTFASRTLQRLFSSCHIAFPSLPRSPITLRRGKKMHVRSL